MVLRKKLAFKVRVAMFGKEFFDLEIELEPP